MSTAAAGSAHVPTVLMVFPWCLDRIGHGNIQRVLAMARYLSQHGVVIDLVYQGNPRVESREHEFTGFRRVLRVTGWKSSKDARITSEWETFYSGFEPAPPNFGPGTALTAVVRGLLDAISYTAVISSYAWTAPIFEGIRTTRIVDLHDVISLHGARSEQATGAASPYSMAEATEQYLWRKWDVLLAITQDEARLVAPTLRPAQQLLTVPHAVPVVEAQESVSDSVVYTGSDNPSNQEAVKWLLADVWPLVLQARPRSTLRLVGLVCEAIAKTPLASTPNVELVGFVERPLEEVRKAAVCVAPYLYGTGLKLKVIEAAGAGRAIVTTTTGIEGTGLVHDTHLLVADDAKTFASAIVRALDDIALRRRLSVAARSHVVARFSEEACYGPLLKLLRSRTEMVAEPGVIPSSVEDRLREAMNGLNRPSVIVWGNGSHTRALVAVLNKVGAEIRCIVDKGAVQEGTSAEGLPVVPGRAFTANTRDLIVLSSQTYESEMWEDLAPVRATGAHVLALYRRELVSEVLKRRLREHVEKAAVRGWIPARGANTGTRLIIAEPSAGRSRGPFLRLARSLEGAALRENAHVIVAGARVAALDGLEPEDRKLLEPTFEFAHWDALHEVYENAWRGVTRFARLMSSDLDRLSSRLALTERDAVLFHTSNLIDVLGAVNWLSSTPPRKMPDIRLLFHFVPAQEAQWLKLTEAEVRHGYRVALAQLEERAGERLRCLAQTNALAGALEDAFDRHFHAMGFPVPERLRGASNVQPASPPRVLYAGEARADKGFGMLPGVADALARELRDGQLRLVCQSMLNEFADDRITAAARALAARPGVELIDRFLPSAEYDDLVASCDAILLPYDAEQYRSRLSAVFVDATCAGVAAIVPEGTWMSAQLELGLGAGECFDGLHPDQIADAVRRVVKSVRSMKRAAREASNRAWRHHDPRAVLETILAPNGVPA